MNDEISIRDYLTCSPLCNFLRYAGYDREYCQHDLFVRVLSRLRWWDHSVSQKSLKELGHVSEDVDKPVIIGTNGMSLLKDSKCENGTRTRTGIKEDTHGEDYTNANKYDFGR